MKGLKTFLSQKKKFFLHNYEFWWMIMWEFVLRIKFSVLWNLSIFPATCQAKWFKLIVERQYIRKTATMLITTSHPSYLTIARHNFITYRRLQVKHSSQFSHIRCWLHNCMFQSCFLWLLQTQYNSQLHKSNYSEICQ